MATRAVPVRVGYTPIGYYVWVGFLSALVLVGLYAFFVQTTQGQYLTGESDIVPWGLYIAAFVFFVGASAGGTVIGLMIHGFGRKDYAPLGTRALLMGLFCLAGAVLFILVHVGNLPRAFLLPWVWRNPTSMFMYTSVTYYMFGIIILAELFFAVRIARGVATERDRKAAKWLAIAAVPFALGVLHAPHGALFAVIKARPFWNSPLLPPHFAVVALVTGTAIMLQVALITSALTKKALVGAQTLSHMGALLAFFIAIAGFLDFFDLLVFAYSDATAGNEAAHFLGETHLPLSILHAGGYFIAFGILLFPQGRTTPGLAIASAIAIIAVAAYRYNLTVVGVSVSLFSFIPHEHYSPQWVEVLVSIGIVALVLLLYSVAVKVVPLEEEAVAPEP